MAPPEDAVDRYKRQAAEVAAGYVQSGMVVGFGHGSTAIYAIRRIAATLASGELRDVRAVPTSHQVERDAQSVGIPLVTLDECPAVDLTIDGADEFDPALNLIKGGGGALLREKVVAQASRRLIIVVDYRKRSPRLGTHFPVPLEVMPFAVLPVMQRLDRMGGHCDLRAAGSEQPFETDQANWVVDWHTGPLDDPHATAHRLEQIAGILGHGLFLGMTERVIVAGPEGIEELTPDGA